jgi:hypothetical protein
MKKPQSKKGVEWNRSCASDPNPGWEPYPRIAWYDKKIEGCGRYCRSGDVHVDRQTDPATAKTGKVWLRLSWSLRPFLVFWRADSEIRCCSSSEPVLIGAETVPYVPKMFSAKDPPKHVTIRILLYCNLVLSDTTSIHFIATGYGCI